MTGSRITKSWIEKTMAEADAQYAAAQLSQDVYHAPRTYDRPADAEPAISAASGDSPKPQETAQRDIQHDAIPRPERPGRLRTGLRQFRRAASFMVVGAGAMLGIMAYGNNQPAVEAEVTPPQTLQDPIAMIASIAPAFTSGDIVVRDRAALQALDSQLDIIRQSAMAALATDAGDLQGYVTRVYGGVFEVPFNGSALIGPPGAEPRLISFNRAQSGTFGGYIDGEFVTIRVGDTNALSSRLPDGCSLALASVQNGISATFLLRCI